MLRLIDRYTTNSNTAPVETGGSFFCSRLTTKSPSPMFLQSTRSELYFDQGRTASMLHAAALILSERLLANWSFGCSCPAEFQTSQLNVPNLISSPSFLLSF